MIAFLPARGGSKGIPQKNVRMIAGRPLIHWVLDAATGSRSVDRVFVATDDEEIAGVAWGYGHPKVEVIGRSPETSSDAASTESAMIEFAHANMFEHILLLQATSPLLTAAHLDDAIDAYEASGADSMVSVVRQRRFLWRETTGGMASPVNYDPARRPRRQDFDGYLVENGAFYVCRRDDLLRTGSRLNGRIKAFQMPEETYTEIDEPSDWPHVERLLLSRPNTRDKLVSALARIRMVLTDMDGVLTDAGMYYAESGDELKKFNTRDGMGFELLRKAGILTGIVTSETTKLAERRALKLKVDVLVQGAEDKQKVLDDILERFGLESEQIAFIGDDVNDLAALQHVGISASPADAAPEIQRSVNIVTKCRGGEGCFRELAERILAAPKVTISQSET